MGAVDVLYERFDKNLQAVNGNSWLANKAEAAGIIANAYKEAGVDSVCIKESPLLKEIGVVKALSDAGIEVFTDHIRLHAETAKGGITEAQCGIADLGSLIQMEDDIDCRMIAIMPEYYIGVVKASTIVDDYDAAFYYPSVGIAYRSEDGTLAPGGKKPPEPKWLISGYEGAGDMTFDCRFFMMESLVKR